MDLSDHKRLRYLDYRLNNDRSLMKKYPRKKYPRLVDYLVRKYGPSKLNSQQKIHLQEKLYHALWRQGLFHSCQA